MGSQGLPEVAGSKGSGGSTALNFSTLHNEIDKAIQANFGGVWSDNYDS